MNATVNYIRKHYPPPWDEATEKLVVFLLGVVSHQTADVSWHGLGIEQGFLDAMGAINFHGSFDTAHPIGDVGGDIMTVFEFNISHMPYVEEWYIPVDDLYNIYTELFGAAVMPKDVIEACTLELFAERFGEKLAIDKLYADYAGKSPYLVDELTDYFLGGLDDMAVWTQNVWQETILMLEKGTGACTIDHNPLFIQCGDGKERQMQKGGKKPERNGFFRERKFTDVQGKDFIVKKLLRGVSLSPAPPLQEALYRKQKQKEAAMMKRREQQRKQTSTNQKYPDAVYSVNNTYAKLGWSIAVGDLDRDGNEDAVIGAPGYRVGHSPQVGAVFILFGTDKGLPLSGSNLEETADVVLYGLEYLNGRLGSSVAIVDINQDGIPDVAAGAPSLGSSQLTYSGSVEVYYGVGRRTFIHNMSISCEAHYCNLGRSLAAGDINGDGFLDLLIGSPFSGAKGEQRGMVSALLSDKKYQGHFAMLSVSELDWTAYGNQNYSWFGHSVKAVENPLKQGSSWIFVSEPTVRWCGLPNGSFADNDTQSVGQLSTFVTSKSGPILLDMQQRGSDALQSFGSSVAVGRPYPDGTLIRAVGATGQNVAGSCVGIHIQFPQTGAVHLYNMSNPHQPPLAIFEGDRRYSRFGSQLTFSDVNQDGFDDLIVGAPFRTDDITEEIHAGEEGAAYIYYGGASFPKGRDAMSKCPDTSLCKPCPADLSSVELKFGEDKARFGSQFAVVKSKTKIDVLVTALHSSHGARLSGAVAVYSFQRR
ncbi:phosphatidylinositol-glycan-specific phospholipase D-like isoform X2 [Littorina saxatilis]